MWHEFLVNVLFPTIAVVLTGLIAAIGNKLLKKFNISVSEDQRKQALASIETWILAVENKAEQACDEGGPSMSGAEKFMTVLKSATSAFPKIPASELSNMIHSRVLAIPGIGLKDLVPRSPWPVVPSAPPSGKVAS